MVYPVLATPEASPPVAPSFHTGPSFRVDSLVAEILVTPSASKSFETISSVYKVQITGRSFVYLLQNSSKIGEKKMTKKKKKKKKKKQKKKKKKKKKKRKKKKKKYFVPNLRKIA